MKRQLLLETRCLGRPLRQHSTQVDALVERPSVPSALDEMDLAALPPKNRLQPLGLGLTVQ